MCCIIHRPKEAKEIPLSNLEKIIKINSDGWGISYYKNNLLHVVRSLNMEEVIEQIRELEKEDIEFIFHARYTTHGENIIENCHPYNLINGVMFHNGKINIHCRNKKFSDTYFFSLKVNKFLRKNRTVDWIVNRFKSIIGPSRLAFMSDKGVITKFGTWHNEDGSFYSKLNWKWNNNYGYGYAYDNANWNDEYGGWVNAPTKQPSLLTPAPTSSYSETEDAFVTALQNCREGKPLYPYILKKLNETELLILGGRFPKLCADYAMIHWK